MAHLTFLAYELVDGFDRPPSLVSIGEMGAFGVVVMQPGIEVGRRRAVDLRKEPAKLRGAVAPGEAAELQQLTGVIPLVAPDRAGRFEGIEPVEPCPAQESANRGGRDSHRSGNLDPRLALETQRRDARDDVRWRGPGLSTRPRTATGQTAGAFCLIPGDPLAHGARTDAHGSGDEAYRQLVVEHAGNEFGSTHGGGSGILMDVHSVLQNETLALFTISFSCPDRVDNVLKGHTYSFVLTCMHFAVTAEAARKQQRCRVAEKRYQITVLLDQEERVRFKAYYDDRGFKKSTARLIRDHLDNEGYRLRRSLSLNNRKSERK